MKRCFLKKQPVFMLAGILAVVLAWLPGTATADETSPPAGSETGDHPAPRFTWDLRVLSFGVLQQSTNSTQNRSNNFLQIPRYVADGEVRPDLRLNLDPLDLSVKPRARLDYSFWQNGVRKGDSQWDDDSYVNEWLARLKVQESLFVSYGRENLQWGPSFLFSPSNPFFQDNGRRNTFLEVPGMDFARLVWIPSGAWSLSGIVNTDEGLNKATGPGRFLASTSPPTFEKTYTLKVDYTNREYYGSLILSRRADAENVAGIFGGWTVTDAILLYGEGAVTQGSQGLYPEKNPSPLGASMTMLHKHDSALYPALLLGGSYTLETNGTMTVEYLYYGPGYDSADANSYYALRRRAAGAASQGGTLSGLGMEALGATAGTGLRFLRRNYAMLQYSQTNVRNKIDLTFRWTQNLDDGSGQLTALTTYSLGKHTQLFSVATVMAGGKNTEFGSVLDYQWMLGLEYTF